MNKILYLVLVGFLILSTFMFNFSNAQSNSGTGVVNINVWPLDSYILINNTIYRALNGSLSLHLNSGSYNITIYRYGFTPISTTINVIGNSTQTFNYKLSPFENGNFKFYLTSNPYHEFFEYANGSDGSWAYGNGYELLGSVYQPYSQTGSDLITLLPAMDYINASLKFYAENTSNYDFGVQFYGAFPSYFQGNSFLFGPLYGLEQNGFIFGAIFSNNQLSYIFAGNNYYNRISGNYPSNGIFWLNVTAISTTNGELITVSINGIKLAYNVLIQNNQEYQLPYFTVFSNYESAGMPPTLYFQEMQLNVSNPQEYFIQGYVNPKNATVIQWYNGGGWNGQLYNFGNLTLDPQNGYYISIYNPDDNLTYFIANGYITYGKASRNANTWFNASLISNYEFFKNYSKSGYFDSFPYYSKEFTNQNFNLCWTSNMVSDGSYALLYGCSAYIMNFSDDKFIRLPYQLCCARTGLFYKDYAIIGGNNYYNNQNLPVIEIYNISSGAYNIYAISSQPNSAVMGMEIVHSILYAMVGVPLVWSPNPVYPLAVYELNLTNLSSNPTINYFSSPSTNLFIPYNFEPSFFSITGDELNVIVQTGIYSPYYLYGLNITTGVWTNETGQLLSLVSQSSIFSFGFLEQIGQLNFYFVDHNIYAIRNWTLVFELNSSELGDFYPSEIIGFGKDFFAAGTTNMGPSIYQIYNGSNKSAIKQFGNFTNLTRFYSNSGFYLSTNPYITNWSGGLFVMFDSNGPFESNFRQSTYVQIYFNESRLTLRINPSSNDTVYVDGQLISQGNFSSYAILLNAGFHNITVYNPNYYSFYEKFYLSPLSNLTLNINLTKATSYLIVNINVNGTKFIIDNLVYQYNGKLKLPLPMGSYSYLAQHKYFNSKQGTVIVNSGINYLNITLQRADGFLYIKSNVPNFVVLVNGSYYYASGYDINISVYPGVYNVSISHQYYNNLTFTNVAISSNNTTAISANLIKSNGTLEFQSFTKAPIFLNGNLIAESPGLYKMQLSPGLYWFNISEDGFILSEMIEITPLNVTDVLLGQLTIHINVNNSKITLISVNNQKATLVINNGSMIELFAGSYAYRVTHEYFNSVTGNLAINIGYNYLNLTLMPADGSLNITTNVAGFEAIIGNSSYVSNFNYLNLSLEPGHYNITVLHAYYSNVTVDNVIVTSNNTTKLPIYLVKADGTLEISTVTNAYVYLDQRLITNTVGNFTMKLPEGIYWINVTQFGFEITTTVQVTSLNTTSIAMGGVKILFNIPQAILNFQYQGIYGNFNKSANIQNDSVVELFPGLLTITAGYSGYLNSSASISIYSGTITSVNLILQKATAYLVGRISPQYAQIKIGYLLINVYNGSFNIGVKPGYYSIKFMANWYEPQYLNTTLNLGKNWVNISLIKLTNLTVNISVFGNVSMENLVVSLISSNNMVYNGTIINGKVYFTNVPYGNYTLVVSSNNGKSYYPIYLTSSPTNKMTVNLFNNAIAWRFSYYVLGGAIISFIVTLISVEVNRRRKG